MARDPVEALLRLCHMTVDEARRDLASCLSAEENAAGAAREIEMRSAGRPSRPAAWMPTTVRYRPSRTG